MKKIMIVIIISILACIDVYARSIFDDVFNGEYVYFMDNRIQTPFYRGYIYYTAENQSYLFVRSVNLSNNDEALYQIIINTNKIEDSKTNLISGKNSLNHQQACVDVFNFITAYNLNNNKISYEYEFKDKWEKYTYYYNFNKIAPVFKIYSLKMEFPGKKKEENPRYYINRSGIIDIKKISEFKVLKPLNTDFIKNRNSNVKLSGINEKSIIANGVKIILDDNWTSQKNINFPSYWIKKESVRDAQISIETGDWSKFKSKGYNSLDDFIKYIVLSSPGVNWNYFKVEKAKDKMVVQYAVIDENNFQNFMYQEYLIKKGELIIINFSSFFSIFMNNHEYFNKIINSIDY